LKRYPYYWLGYSYADDYNNCNFDGNAGQQNQPPVIWDAACEVREEKLVVWLIFIISAVVIVLAAIQLARSGDVIAIRTGLGGMFVGLVLLAAATSLPELLTSFVAIREGSPNLAVGNLLGSNMVNMFMLVILDLIFYRQRILRSSLLKHALSGSLAVLMIGLAIFFMLGKLEWQIGWVGVDSLVIILVYLGSIWLIQNDQSLSRKEARETKEDLPADTPPMWKALVGLSIAIVLLIGATPFLVSSSEEIARITGLGTTFIGTTLVAFVTSLPELVTTLAAARIGATAMAIGNLFGSNMFNIFVLGLSDLFYTKGRMIPAIDPAFLLVATLGLVMTSLALIGNLARIKRRILFIDLDALFLTVIYFGGLYFLYLQGINR
jgi:cation:H+ antiporter